MTASRHLAIFVRSLSGGGAERVLLNLSKAFAARGHRVDLLIAEAGGPLEADVTLPVRLQLLQTPPKRFTRLPDLAKFPLREWSTLAPLLRRKPPYVIGTLPALVAYLERERPDAMLSALHWNTIVSIWANRLAGVATRQVVSERNVLSREVDGSTKRYMQHLIPLVSAYYPRADGIIAVSDGVADDLSRVAGIARERITTIYNPTVTPDLEAKAAAEADHPWFGDGGPPVVLAVGRLQKQKDYPTLLRAFAKVRERRPLRLIILGEGKDRAAIEALIAELGLDAAVSMPGFAKNPIAYMARAALFVLASRWEGLPNVLIEALAVGCPVVSTDCESGPSEILEGERWGPLVAVGDVDALAAAMDETLEKPPDREWLRGGAQRFTLDRVADRYLEILLGE